MRTQGAAVATVKETNRSTRPPTGIEMTNSAAEGKDAVTLLSIRCETEQIMIVTQQANCLAQKYLDVTWQVSHSKERWNDRF